MPSHDPNPSFRKAIVFGSIFCVALVAAAVFLVLRQTDGSAEARLIVGGSPLEGGAGGLAVDPNAGGLRLCNKTSSNVGVAVGYKLDEAWTTEGWWNVATDSCETLVKGQLLSRFYYVHAIDYDHGGVWGGKAIMCTQSKKFTIEGIVDCIARGFERTGFFEVDTGEQKSWTVQLTEPGVTENGDG